MLYESAWGERYDVEFVLDNPCKWHIYNSSDRSPVSGRLLDTLLYDGITSNTFNTDNITRYRISDYSMFEGITIYKTCYFCKQGFQGEIVRLEY